MTVLSEQSKNFKLWRDGQYSGDAGRLLRENVEGLCRDLQAMNELISSTEDILKVMAGEKDTKHWSTLLKIRERSKQNLNL